MASAARPAGRDPNGDSRRCNDTEYNPLPDRANDVDHVLEEADGGLGGGCLFEARNTLSIGVQCFGSRPAGQAHHERAQGLEDGERPTEKRSADQERVNARLWGADQKTDRGAIARAVLLEPEPRWDHATRTQRQGNAQRNGLPYPSEAAKLAACEITRKQHMEQASGRGS